MGKTWFVTGASRGLGRSFVEAALARGDTVAATIQLSSIAGIEPAGFATRAGKNPDPLDNGHMAQANPVYDGLRQRLAGFTKDRPAGDPAAAARTLLKIVDSDNPPLRVLFGQGFHQMIEQVYAGRTRP